MNENIEMGYLLTSSIEGTAMLIKGSAYVVQETLKLMQCMARKARNKELSPGEYKNFTKFIKRASGNMSYLNVPAEGKYAAQVKNDLKKLKIPYYVLPELRNKNGMMQIVYPEKYKSAVQPWFEKYCSLRLEEGSFKNPQTLAALAGGQGKTGIVTIPTEDYKVLKAMEEDFRDLHISYYLLPDTNQGDGLREVMYAKKDEEKIQHWLENFCQKNIMQGGEKTAKELQAIAGNKGQIGFIGIPTEKGTIQQMKKEFQRLGINYHLMDDLHAGDGLTQVMYLKKDEVAVRNWYSSYATDKLIKGGKKDYKDLMNLTNGKVQLVSIPITADKQAAMMADLESLHVNFCVMPPLKINDNSTMLLYAAADAERVKGWYEMYQENLLQGKTHIEPQEMQKLSMEEYMKSAEMKIDDYIEAEQQLSLSPEEENKQETETLKETPERLKEIEELPEEPLEEMAEETQKELPEELAEESREEPLEEISEEVREELPEDNINIPGISDEELKGMREVLNGEESFEPPAKKNESLTDNPNYLWYDGNPDYEKISIQEELVVDGRGDIFMARIPGEKEEYFLCDSKCVFADRAPGEKNKKYVAFIAKNHRQMVCDKQGNILPSLGGKEILERYSPLEQVSKTVKNLSEKGIKMKPMIGK